MKTAMQEMFSQLEIDQPQLFNVYTPEGKAFINSFIKFIQLEKYQIETAFKNGQFDGIENEAKQTSSQYFIQEFLDK